MPNCNRLLDLVLPIAVFASVSLGSPPALASEVFPGAIQEAADMQCVPTCLLCHTTNPGEAGTWTKSLGTGLKTVVDPRTMMPALKPGDEASLKTAFALYASNSANQASIARIKAGQEPTTGANICGPTYGCGAHIAKEPSPRDFSAALWVVGAVAAAALLRRRK